MRRRCWPSLSTSQRARPILLYAHDVAGLLERYHWDADVAAEVLSNTVDAQRRAGDESWDRRRR